MTGYNLKANQETPIEELSQTAVTQFVDEGGLVDPILFHKTSKRLKNGEKYHAGMIDEELRAMSLEELERVMENS